MFKRDLLKLLDGLPDDAPIVVDAEGGIDLAQSVRLVNIRKTAHDWSSTPVGNYRLADDTDNTECVGEAVPAIFISLDAL